MGSLLGHHRDVVACICSGVRLEIPLSARTAGLAKVRKEVLVHCAYDIESRHSLEVDGTRRLR